MAGLSIVIIAFNEERNIGRCLHSVKGIADEIVVVDSYSKDRTADLCRSAGARVVQHPFEGHIEQKTFALTHAAHDRVLSIDADEALSEELRASILAAKDAWSHDTYEVNRLTNYCGTWIRHGGWYPDRKIRLFDRRKGRWAGVNPHDRFVPQNGATGARLDGDLYHYSYYTVEDHLKQIDYFTGISAKTMRSHGRTPSLLRMLAGPPFRFFRDYVLKRGFLDGYAGLVISALSAYAVFVKHAKLRQLYESE